MKLRIKFLDNFLLALVVCVSCTTNAPTVLEGENEENDEPKIEEPSDQSIIDLSHWKVTLPIGNPSEVEPPEILDYSNVDILKPYMYDDQEERALVFHTEPGSTTANTSYSRTELREQMVPGSNSTNWTFAIGGRMKGTLALDTISKDASGKFHRTIIMQIHGRLTNDQRNEIGEDDNNAPPVLKIYWNDGRVRVLRKVLKDVNVSYPDILRTDAWTDEGFWFNERVDKEKFTLEVIVEEGKMKVILNDNEELLFDDIHIEKWNVFENYFKAGNYLITTDIGSFATIKYYDLVVEH